MSYEEELALLDEQAQLYLDVSGKEFIRRWEAGEYTDPDAQPGVMWVASLLPRRRQTSPGG